ncbi:hypothetical protein NW755_012422 [Fusarium falciforme]|uniref:Heterokaryon incompatibility domain-containing protein n=1 Tax=Fusarium falciforme TaxID=195108 RepID=A0A9W8QY26_9HYPO|nr:hypothetical protein NW755_012422 [Fusarium falciforme]
MDENVVNVGDQGAKSHETTASSQDHTQESNEAPDEPEQGSYCCYIALTMAARVLKAPSTQKMLEAIREGADLDDLILNIECVRPPTESEPWEPDMPDKQGYGHIYALLGCLMATAYVRQCFAVETIYLDRAISNLDVAILKIPESPFKEFREYLQRVRKEVSQIQVLFHRIELLDDAWKNGVFCAICLDFKPIVGFHETEYPSHKMNFSKLCRNASLRCRICTLLRDATASLYPLLDTSWEDIAEISYENRSVGRRWYLWIDSLCIVQDDENDWAVQSSKMSDVYQNAYITIAAAAARNSTEGCFQSRPFSVRKSFATVAEVQDKVEQVEVFARPWQSNRHWTTNIGDGPRDRAQNPLRHALGPFRNTFYPGESFVSPPTSWSGTVVRSISASVARDPPFVRRPSDSSTWTE